MHLNHIAEHFGRDLRLAFNQLLKRPGFTLTAVITLSLGIGANAVVFGVLDAVILRPLPFRTPDRLVRVWSIKDDAKIGPSALDSRDFARRNRTFEKLAVYDQWPKNVSVSNGEANAEWLMVGLVPAEFFEALGIRPQLGRLFSPEENTRGHNHVALITASFWKSRYAGTPAILGQQLTINHEPYTIIGVLPDGIPDWMNGANARIDIWEPFFPVPNIFDESSRGGRGFETVGLLKPGVTVQQARADLETIAASLTVEHPIDRGFSATVEPLIHSREGDLRPQLFLLMGAVSLVLFIACSNLASLLLARNASRQREFATRMALGGSRGVLIRQILVETLLLSWMGGICAIGLAAVCNDLLRMQHPANLVQLQDITLNWRILSFTFLIATGTSLLFALLPAFLQTRTNLNAALKEGGRNSSDRSRLFFRRLLVSAQIALSLILMVGAGLLLQTIFRLQSQNLGFPPAHLLTARFYLPPAQYGSSAAITQFCDHYAANVRSLPGIERASVTTIYFSDEDWEVMFSIPGRVLSRSADAPTTLFGVVDAQFLSTVGIPVFKGRDFLSTDTESSQKVAIVNQAFADRYFSGENPLGKTIKLGAPPASSIQDDWLDKQNIDVTVIGVMQDAKNLGLTLPAQPQLFGLFRQLPIVNRGFKDIIVRSTVKTEVLGHTLEQQLRLLDPSLALSGVSSMEDHIKDLTSGKRFTSTVLVAFALLGTLLAVVGIYGVVSYLVVQRTQELAVRLALGAEPSKVLWLVLREGMQLAVFGVGAGLLAMKCIGPLLSRLLYGISSFDLLTLGSASIGLLMVAFLASAVAGRHAIKIDPIQALRAE
jgi:putative ABC transport system permease protein